MGTIWGYVTLRCLPFLSFPFLNRITLGIQPDLRGETELANLSYLHFTTNEGLSIKLPIPNETFTIFLRFYALQNTG